jgi:hypothetical protein
MVDILTPSLAHALILSACAEPCLYPGEHYKDRLRPLIKTDDKTSTPPKSSFGTWLAAGAEIMTIGKYRHGVTMIFIPSRDIFYFASPNALLSAECPDGSIFVGQFLIDNDNPRILIFDTLKLRNVSCAELPAPDRYGELQKMTSYFGPLCSVQWAGDLAILIRDLKSKKFVVPHAIQGVMALGSVPGRMTVYEYGKK